MTKKRSTRKGRVICKDCTRDMGSSNARESHYSVCTSCVAIRLKRMENDIATLRPRQLH